MCKRVTTAVILACLIGQRGIAMAATLKPSHAQRAALLESMARHGIPGAAAALVVNGEVRFALSLGWADCRSHRALSLDSPMMLASLVKPLLGIAAYRAAQQHANLLDRPVASLVPGLSPSYGSVTLHQLLSHQAGLAGGAVPAYTSLAYAPSDSFAFGRLGGFSYGNAAFYLAGEILSQQTGLPGGLAIARELGVPWSIAPARVTGLPPQAAVGYLSGRGCSEPIQLDQAWGLAAPGAGQGIVSMSQMLPWLRVALFDDWHTRFFLEVSRRATPVHRGFLDVGYALGWYVHQNEVGPVYEHNGFLPGFGGFLRVVPSRGFALLVLANQGPGVPLTTFIDQVTRESLLDWLPRRKDAKRRSFGWRDLGIWGNSPGFRLRFELRNGRIHMCELPAGRMLCSQRYETIQGPDGRLWVRHPQFMEPIEVYLERSDPFPPALHYLSRRFERVQPDQ